jgi:hypothetical protein
LREEGNRLVNGAVLGSKIGWGGRIRTFTVLINSEVSYQLDHAPAVLETASGKQAGNAAKKLALGNKIITRGARPEKLPEMKEGISDFYWGNGTRENVDESF